ncbi:MAG: hypothetical protein IPN33_22700 [Saprospiraceae bacterium]|nr:hypothetical protein [Saprospiraceae bacterium]
MKDGQTIQTLILARAEKASLMEELNIFHQQCKILLHLIYNNFHEGNSLLDWYLLLDHLNIEDVSRLEMILIYLKRMGYIRFEGSAMPFAIEVYKTASSDDTIDHRNPSHLIAGSMKMNFWKTKSCAFFVSLHCKHSPTLQTKEGGLGRMSLFSFTSCVRVLPT